MDGWSPVVFVVCCVGSSLCDGLITYRDVFCRLCVCDLQTTKNKFSFTVVFLETYVIRLLVQAQGCHSHQLVPSSSPFETTELKIVLK